MVGTAEHDRRSTRGLAATVVLAGSALVVSTPVTVAVLLGLTAPRCGLTLFEACGTPSPWWVSAVYFLGAILLFAVPVVAGSAMWRGSWARAGLAAGLLVVGMLVLGLPSS